MYHDAKFKQMVDYMVATMNTQQISPYELRDAAYMASVQFEQMHLSPRAILHRFPEDAQDILYSMGCRPPSKEDE